MRLILLMLICMCPSLVSGANIYVDTTAGDCTGNYSISSRNCSGADGNSYDTIQEAVTAASSGDVIQMRGGTYDVSQTTGEGSITLDGKDGTDWSEGNYFTLKSYPGEWAIIDGNHDMEEGNIIRGSSSSVAYGMSGNSVQYWLFERFEIKNAGESGESTASAFWLGLGPFKFRYLYIHDNYSGTYTDNSSGVSLFESNGSFFEYCWFDNNGSNSSTSHNNSHICYYADQTEEDTVAQYGFTTQNGTRNNEARYCYFASSSLSGDAFKVVGIKDKGAQFLTGRNADGSNWSDTLIEQGHHIHHNFFNDVGRESVFMESDFAQVWQNVMVINEGGPAIAFQYFVSGRPQLYKCASWNNTIINSTGTSLVRYGEDEEDWSFTEDYVHYGFDVNNILEGGSGTSPGGEQEIFTVIPYYSGSGSTVSHDLTNYTGANNVFYDAGSSDIVRLYDISYTSAEYEAQSLTHTPRTAYEISTTPFKDISGSDRYCGDGTYVVESGVTIADGGTGGSHSYLSGVTLPSFLGATDPDDDGWVYGVLNDLTSTTWLRSTSTDRDANDDPTWIEGGSETPAQTPTISGVSIN